MVGGQGMCRGRVVWSAVRKGKITSYANLKCGGGCGKRSLLHTVQYVRCGEVGHALSLSWKIQDISMQLVASGGVFGEPTDSMFRYMYRY